MTTGAPEPTRLVRRLGTFDAVVIGLGSMLGAGVFVAFSPAAGAAGEWLVASVLVAATVATANALSSAQLAARYPESGGAYVYGRRRLHPVAGYLAGWGFVVGKTASCAAMALTFATYAAPDAARAVAIAAVAVLTALNLLGVRKTMVATFAILAAVVAALVVAAVAGWTGGRGASATSAPGSGVGTDVGDVLRGASIMFFAFAGYARIATLGEEVRDPARTIPRAVPFALGVALAVYVVVAGALLHALTPAAIAASETPLREVTDAHTTLSGAGWVVTLGAAIACLGVLLSLLAGVTRTVFAMADDGELPAGRALAAVSARTHVPHRAQLATGVAVALDCLVVDVGDAIGFSAFCVLLYYAVANAAALRLTADERRWPRWVSMYGLGACVALAFLLPVATVGMGVAVLLVGLVVRVVRSYVGRRGRNG